jgi:hypothetical protein
MPSIHARAFAVPIVLELRAAALGQRLSRDEAASKGPRLAELCFLAAFTPQLETATPELHG